MIVKIDENVLLKRSILKVVQCIKNCTIALVIGTPSGFVEFLVFI